MALQPSGTISIGNIRTEMNLTGISNFSLDLAANGIYVPLNPYSPTHPVTSGSLGVYGMAGTNETISSWYSYCHFCSIPCSTTAGGLTSVYYAVVNFGTTSGTIGVVINWIHPASFNVYYGNPYNTSGTLVGTPIFSTSGSSGTTTTTFTYTYNGSSSLLYVYAGFAVTSWSLSCPYTYYTWVFNDSAASHGSSNLACSSPDGGPSYYALQNTMSDGMVFYTNTALTTYFVGNGGWYNVSYGGVNYAAQINTIGTVVSHATCGPMNIYWATTAYAACNAGSALPVNGNNTVFCSCTAFSTAIPAASFSTWTTGNYFFSYGGNVIGVSITNGNSTATVNVVCAGCPAPTTTSTTTTTTTVAFAASTNYATSAYDACNAALGSISVTGNAGSFCSSTSFVGAFATFATGTYYLSYGGNSMQISVTNGSTTATVTSGCTSCPAATTSTTTTTTTTSGGYVMSIFGKKDTNTPGSVYVWYSINGGAYTKALTGTAMTTGGLQVGTVTVPVGQTITVAVSTATDGPGVVDYSDNATQGGSTYPLFVSCTCNHYITYIPGSSQNILVSVTGNSCP
jgi:hypothetical protein